MNNLYFFIFFITVCKIHSYWISKKCLYFITGTLLKVCTNLSKTSKITFLIAARY